MKIGFVGVGAIASAMVTGLLRSPQQISEIWLSPRNAQNAQRLSELDPRIVVAASNQEVLDRAELIFLAVRPQVARAVLADLAFLPRHHVISLMALVSGATLRAWLGPVAAITRATPLPLVASNSGITPYFPADPVAKQLFGALGMAIETASAEELDLYVAASALMATFFQILGTAGRTLAAEGLEPAAARAYIEAIFAGLLEASKQASARNYDELEREYATAGGLNEQVSRVFREKGGSAALSEAMLEVLGRIRGNTI